MDTGLPDSVYVQVLARLQLIPTPTDSAARAEADSLRALVLEEHQVEPEQLIEFAEVVGREPGRSEQIWEQIGATVDSIREVDGLDPPQAIEAGSEVRDPAVDGSDAAGTGAGADDRGADLADRPAWGDGAPADSMPEDDSTAEQTTPQVKPQLVPGARRERPAAGRPIRNEP